MSNEAAEKIEALKREIGIRLEDIRILAVENDLPTHFQMGTHSYKVFLPSEYDEEDLDYYTHEYGIEPGNWVSSSELC